ncbi:MAG: accessory gene regulator B family protein [Ruminococcus sp.]
MITFLSKTISHFLYRNSVINKQELEVYQYGFEIIISTLLGFLITLLVGVVFQMILLSVLYYVIFVVLRQLTGGYHADSYLKCNLVFFGVSLFTLGMTKLCYFSNMYTITFHVLILAIVVLSVCKFAPIENPNKPMTEDELKRNHRFAIVLTLVLAAVSCILFYFQLEISILIAFTLLSISVLIVIAKTVEGGVSNE